MAVNLNAVSVASALAVTPVAPLIEGSAAVTLNNVSHNSASSANYDFGSGLTGRRGMRVNPAAPLDLTGHDFITFASGTTNYGIGISNRVQIKANTVVSRARSKRNEVVPC